jgi:hypothetical protein
MNPKPVKGQDRQAQTRLHLKTEVSVFALQATPRQAGAAGKHKIKKAYGFVA